MQTTSYDLFLDLDFKKLKFDGKVAIELESEGDVKLNSLGLEILHTKGNGRTFPHKQSGEDLVIGTGPFKGKLEIEYRGPVSEALVGLYKAPYGDSYVLSTQFEAASARRLLPCADHPEYKAEFKLAVKADPDLDVISNMPVESSMIDGDKKVVTFQKTPRMSTYLLYLGVGNFEESQSKFGTVDVAVTTTPGKAGKTEYAMDVMKQSLKFYEKYFDSRYQLPKLDLIGVPEFAQGAMENWGAITFREVYLLVDQNTSVRVKKLVAEVIAHEVAHQWFGNLVTMKWWDDLWLNESFATFMAYKVVDELSPQWKVWEDFVRVDTSVAMARDGLHSTHPIEVTINHPSEIEQIFDEISYSKGGSILRMVEAYVGLENFRNGVRAYLQDYKYSNAKGADLWNRIEKFSGSEVSRIMKDWITKPGYPVLTVSFQNGKLKIRQERFFLSGEREKGVWTVPLTMTVNGHAERHLLNAENWEMNLPGVLSSICLNVGRTGFYRVYYEGLYEQVWKGNLSESDRFGIISDALAFTISGRMPFPEYLKLISRFNDEQGYLPAYEVSDQLAFLYSYLPSIADTSSHFHRSQLRILEGKRDENSVALRGDMAYRLAMADDKYAAELARSFSNYDNVEPDLRTAVAAGYARSTGDFEGIVSKYRESKSDEEKVRFLVALMSFKEPALLERSLAFAKSDEVKKQDVAQVLVASPRNPNARATVWHWLKPNLPWLDKIYEGSGIMSRLLRALIPFCGIGRSDEIKQFFAANPLPGSEKGVEGGLERLGIYEKFVHSIGGSGRVVQVVGRNPSD